MLSESGELSELGELRKLADSSNAQTHQTPKLINSLNSKLPSRYERQHYSLSSGKSEVTKYQRLPVRRLTPPLAAFIIEQTRD
jgi:hypothetical protein